MEQEQDQALVAEAGANRSDLDALKDGAAMLSAAGNRVAALSLLWSAVAIDPLDLAAHRRLAATLASGGDLDAAAEEFARYIEFVLPLGDLTRAMLELTYGVNMLGGRAPMRGAAEKIANAVLALVPGTDAALPKLESPSVVAAIADAQLTSPITEFAPVTEFAPLMERESIAPVVDVPLAPTASVATAPSSEHIDIEAFFANALASGPAPVISVMPETVMPETVMLEKVTPEPVMPQPASVITSPQEIELTVATRVDEWATPTHEWTAPLPLPPDRMAERRAAEANVAAAAAREPIFIRPVVAAPQMPGPRLLPKVPFRFCLHPGGDRHWMQLEGGTKELFPQAVRVIDRWENIVEERECLAMRPGDKSHSPATPSYDSAPAAWVVVGVPSQIVAAYEAGLTWAYTFQAKVNGEWLALDLVDSGCRLSRVRPLSAS